MTAHINTDSDLLANTAAAAFVEAVRKLNQAEKTRNADNPGVAPKTNVQMSADFDGGVFNITAALPYATTIDATTGNVVLNVTDYLGAPYSDFDPGTGTAKSTDLPSLVFELAARLQSLEAAVAEADRPNNIQYTPEPEAGTITITATIPFTPTIGALGVVTLAAFNYV
jgi:hypothetical protein